MKTVIVHDYLNQMGGAERVVEEFHSIFPQAPIYTSIYDQKRLPDTFLNMQINPSFMQYLPFVFKFFKAYLPLYPFVFDSMTLPDCDLVLSSSSAFAKAVKKPKGAKHICYCYTPARFLWMYDMYVKRENYSPFLKKVLSAYLDKLKKWDLENVKNVDHFIAISNVIADRIKKFYGRTAEVIYPPVNTDFFVPGTEDGGFYFVASRLNTYKRIDIVVKAFNQLGWPLKIAGSGPDKKDLMKMANPNIEFVGRLPDKQLAAAYAACKALIFPGEEDFGIVPLEAMACGRPVIAYNAGGAKETVIQGKTGLLFDEQTPESLVSALENFEGMSFNKQELRKHAEGFSSAVFRKNIMEFVSKTI